jgi:hypothetical protein
VNVTDLELAVLVRVEAGIDPWACAAGRRAIERLKRKGLLILKRFCDDLRYEDRALASRYVLTLAAREALVRERGVGGRLW